MQAFDALTRRASLVAVGGAGLTALTLSDPAPAKKKKKKNKKKGDVNKLCKTQVQVCVDALTQECGEPVNPICQAIIDQCCPKFGTCDFTGFFTCAEELSAP
jgi:hypothetical protein